MSAGSQAGAASAGAPDLIEPVVGFRSWRTLDGHISSPYVPVRWHDPVLHAVCHQSVAVSAQGFVSEPHRAPHPDCRCGIYAYHAPPHRFAKIDFRTVPGIVTMWGRIEVHRGGMRAEHARICALAFFRGWGGRQKRAASEVAENLSVELVDYEKMQAAAPRFGSSLPDAMLPSPAEQPARRATRWSRRLSG